MEKEYCIPRQYCKHHKGVWSLFVAVNCARLYIVRNLNELYIRF